MVTGRVDFRPRIPVNAPAETSDPGTTHPTGGDPVTDEEPKRDYGIGDDGKGWVETEMRELDQDSRSFLIKVAIVAGGGLAILAGVVWAALVAPHWAGLN